MRLHNFLKYLVCMLCFLSTGSLVLAATPENMPPAANTLNAAAAIKPAIEATALESAGTQTVSGNSMNAQLTALANSPTAVQSLVNIPSPKNLQYKAGGKQVLLAWEPVKLAGGQKASYVIYRSERPLDINSPQTDWPEPINWSPVTEEYFLDSASNSKFEPMTGAKYFYAVSAMDDQGNLSAWSNILEVINQAELSAPTNFTAEPRNAAVKLSWVPAFSGGEYGLAGYTLYRSDKTAELGQPVHKFTAGVSETVDQGAPDQPLQNGATYFYTLFAMDTKGNLSEPTKQVEAIPYQAAVAPEQLTATAKTDDMIELQWEPVKPGTYELKGYDIFRKSDQETEYTKINKQLVTNTFYVDSEKNSVSKPLLGRVYSYKVMAHDAQDHTGAESKAASCSPMVPFEVPSTGLLSTSIPGLPPESSLTISGRKKIDVSYTEVLPLNTKPGGATDRYPSLTSGLTKGFNLEQELQVRLEGKVGKKITVDVDYDDTKEEERKISIIYAGDPDEVIQEAAFGDILLDLPRTEFAGYNKNLFGAKLKVAYDNFRFTAIGAQTKGITITEKFKGNTSPKTIDISDINFRTFKYYYLTKDWPNQVNHPELPKYDPTRKVHGIVPGSEKIYVGNGYLTGDTRFVVHYGQEIRFNRYSPGVDYTVDYERGIVTFNNIIQPTSPILVAYRYYNDDRTSQISVGYTATGEVDFDDANLKVPIGANEGRTSNSAHLIQDYNDSSNTKFYNMMLMNRYSLDYQNILNPQSDPDFVIKVYSVGGQEIYIPLPSDTANADQFYRIDPNFGTIQFVHNYPFQEQKLSTDAQQLKSDEYDAERHDAYNTRNNPSLTSGGDSTLAHQYRIHVEFKNVITTFQLGHWNVLKNSEVIKKDGARLQRNIDYYIDYDTGYLTFLNPEAIATSSEITVTYEYMPFGGKYQSNLFGARGEYDIISKKWSVGSTYLFNASQTPLDIPDVRSSPNALSLIDADMKFNLNPEDFGTVTIPLLGDFKIPLSVDASVEGAYSNFSVNTYRKSGENSVAMIDSMEGSDNVLSLAVDNNIWFPSSYPPEFPAASSRHYIAQSDVFEKGRVWIDDNDKVHQLQWAIGGLNNVNWDGFVYRISDTGTNMHEYRYLEMSVYNSSSTPIVLNVDVGVVSEDSNGNGELNFEADKITLGQGNDIGITNYYLDHNAIPPVIGRHTEGPQGIYPAVYPKGYWGGEENGRLNSEDLDNDDQLDTAESYYRYRIVLRPNDWTPVKYQINDYNTVKTAGAVEVNPQNPAFLSYVKHVRMWVTTDSATPTNASDYLRFESIQFTGNKWQTRIAENTVNLDGELITEVTASTINATAITEKTGEGYVPNKFFYIYDENNETEELQNEQALKISYNINRNCVVDPRVGYSNTLPAYYLQRTLAGDSNYSGYRYLRLDVFKKTATAPGEKLFVRLGIDQNNFYQYEFSMDEAPVGAWQTLKVEMDGSDGHRLAKFNYVNVPSLAKINEVAIGIINPEAFSTDEVIWINNLRVTDAEAKQGLAARLSSNSRWADVFTVNTDFRDVGSDFYMIDESANGKQHVSSSRVTGTISKLSWLPISGTWSRTASFTETGHRDDPSYSNNYNTPDVLNEGINGTVGYTQLQGLDINVNAMQNRKLTEYLDQRYNVNQMDISKEVSPRINYTLPAKIWGVPLGSNVVTGKLTYSMLDTTFDQEAASRTARLDKWDRWMNKIEEMYTFQGNYSPISFTQLSPSMTYRANSERGHLSQYRFYAALDPTLNPNNLHYFSDIFRMSLLERTAKISLNLMNMPVFSPSISYAMTNTRDYIMDHLATPGNLNLQSGVALGELFGWSQFPRLNWSENYSTSATYYNEYGNDPISQLDFNDQWLINPVTFKQNDPKFNSANINSKSLTDNLSTNITLFTDVNLTPQYSSSWTKRMNSPNNFNRTDTLSYGSGLTWTRVPFFPGVNLQSLGLDYRYSENRNFDTNEEEINRNVTHNSSVTLPFRVLSDIGSNLTLQSTNTIRYSGEQLKILVFENLYHGGLSIQYNLNMNQPLKLPNFWPFNGAMLKLQQTLLLKNAFNVDWVRNRGENITGNDKETDTYTNDTSVNYSLWRNVEGSFIFTNQWFYDKKQDNKDYWAIKFKAGLTAMF